MQEAEQKINPIVEKFDEMKPEEIGILISIAIEYLIDFHNYDLDKMINTIRRVHKEMNEGHIHEQIH